MRTRAVIYEEIKHRDLNMFKQTQFWNEMFASETEIKKVLMELNIEDSIKSRILSELWCITI